MSISTFTCSCDSKKERRLILDGGILGNYMIDLCIHCYRSHEKKFVIKEEVLNN